MLQLEWTTQEPPSSASQVLVVPLLEGADGDAIESRFGLPVRQALEVSPFTGKAGEVFTFTREEGGVLRRVLLVGVGSGLSTADLIRRFGHDSVRQAQSHGAN